MGRAAKKMLPGNNEARAASDAFDAPAAFSL